MVLRVLQVPLSAYWVKGVVKVRINIDLSLSSPRDVEDLRDPQVLPDAGNDFSTGCKYVLPASFNQMQSAERLENALKGANTLHISTDQFSRAGLSEFVHQEFSSPLRRDVERADPRHPRKS